MFQEMIRVFKAMVGDPELMPYVAKVQKTYLDALVAEGFARDEAMQIICSQSIMNSQSSKKTQ